MTGLQLFAFVLLPMILVGLGLLAMVLHNRSLKSQEERSRS